MSNKTNSPAVEAPIVRGVRPEVPKRATARMTLKDFASMAGVIVERCDKEFGGTWAYKTADNPRCTYCGHRTEAALYRAWAEDTFGKEAHKALAKLLRAILRTTEDAKSVERYRKLRRGDYWYVVDVAGDLLHGDALDAAVDATPAVGAGSNARADAAGA